MSPEMNPSDWSTSYSQFLAQSAALSARTLRLYQLALEYVSQGKLPSSVFQDYFPSFVVAHGAQFTQRLSEVGSRFLSDLVRLGSRFSQQATETNGNQHDIIPPQFDAANPARWYEQIAEYAGQLNARAVKAYRSQLDRVASGELTPSEVQQQTAQQMAQQMPSYMQMMTQLYFDLLYGLNEVRSAYEESYFRGLLARATSEPGDATAVLTLTGLADTIATASLSVTNTTAQRTLIGYQIRDVRRGDGVGPSVIPAITFSPKSLDLQPGEEGTLTLSLQLDPKQYDPDMLYRGVLLLTGSSDVPVEIELRIVVVTSTQKNSHNQHLA